jgi:DNA-binding transcriptional ArsR family regulator
LACTREAVSKAMSELREGGLIETPRPGRVVVLDELRLSKVAMGQAITAQNELTGDTSEFLRKHALAFSSSS